MQDDVKRARVVAGGSAATPLEFPASRVDMRAALDTHGYVVVTGVLTAAQCDRACGQTWDWLEALSPAIRRAEPDTWATANRPIHSRGLIQHYNVGFQRASIEVRMLASRVFAELYGTAELWTSFDGISVTRRPNGNRFVQFDDLADWEERKWDKDSVHVDITGPGFEWYQGGVALTDQREDEHVFVCVPQSHLHHDRVMTLAGKVTTKNFLVMNDAQKCFLRDTGLDIVRVPVPRGAIILWDSRMSHSSSTYCKTARPDAQRMHVFTCMTPIPKCPHARQKEMHKRCKAYAEGRVSKHSPAVVSTFGKQPQTYGKSQAHFHPQPVADMNAAEKRLHGLIL